MSPILNRLHRAVSGWAAGQSERPGGRAWRPGPCRSTWLEQSRHSPRHAKVDLVLYPGKAKPFGCTVPLQSRFGSGRHDSSGVGSGTRAGGMARCQSAGLDARWDASYDAVFDSNPVTALALAVRVALGHIEIRRPNPSVKRRLNQGFPLLRRFMRRTRVRARRYARRDESAGRRDDGGKLPLLHGLAGPARSTT